MKNLGTLKEGTQIREIAKLIENGTNYDQPNKLFFVHLDEDYAVDNNGCIFQIITKDDAESIHEEGVGYLRYEGESGFVYNYAEDSTDFEEDSEELEIYSHCYQQAELLAEDNL